MVSYGDGAEVCRHVGVEYAAVYWHRYVYYIVLSVYIQSIFSVKVSLN